MWNMAMVGMLIGEMMDRMREALANLGRWKMEAILRGLKGKGRRRRLVLWEKWHLKDGYHI